MRELLRLVPAREPLFPADMLTDRSERFLVGELVREQLFLRLRQEIPYATAVVVDNWEERPGGDVVIDATIMVERDAQKAIVVGKGGAHDPGRGHRRPGGDHQAARPTRPPAPAREGRARNGPARPAASPAWATTRARGRGTDGPARQGARDRPRGGPGPARWWRWSGRPNVGKSSLFNRLVGGRPALVEDLPGVTRDRRYGVCEWDRARFRVVDTGGLDPSAEGILGAMRTQTLRALDEGDVLVFVVDVREGITAVDEDVARLLRRTGKPVFVAANKVDSSQPGRRRGRRVRARLSARCSPSPPPTAAASASCWTRPSRPWASGPGRQADDRVDADARTEGEAEAEQDGRRGRSG